MNDSNYIKQLEQQNEELKQKLADATDRRYIMEWNPKDVENYNTYHRWVYEFRVHGMLFGIILELKRMPVVGELKRYRCVFKDYSADSEFDTIEECKEHVMNKYKSKFMDEPAV